MAEPRGMPSDSGAFPGRVLATGGMCGRPVPPSLSEAHTAALLRPTAALLLRREETGKTAGRVCEEDSFGLIRVHSLRQALPHRVNGRLSSDMERRPPPLADSWCEQEVEGSGGLRQQPAGFIRGRSEGC